MISSIEAAPLPVEHWIDLLQHKGLYRVSSMGRVRRLPRTNTPDFRLSYALTLAPHFNGAYLWVFLRDHQGGRRQYRVDRLVLCGFAGVPYEVFDVGYRNGNRRDCRLENLVRLNTRTRFGPYSRENRRETITPSWASGAPGGQPA